MRWLLLYTERSSNSHLMTYAFFVYRQSPEMTKKSAVLARANCS